MSFCLLLYIFYIFYICISIHKHILYDCTYISITTVIVVHDKVIINFENTLILLSIFICGIPFLNCVQRFWCHALLPTLLPLFLLSNPFLKAEFRNYDKFIFKYSWKAVEEELGTPLTYKCYTKASQVGPLGQW